MAKTSWANNLSALSKVKALDTYSSLYPEDALDYDNIVMALRKRYQLTDEGFRVKFRTTRI